MNTDTELYDLLGVSPSASEGMYPTRLVPAGLNSSQPDEIKKAYRKKV